MSPLFSSETFKNYSEGVCLFCTCRPTHSQPPAAPASITDLSPGRCGLGDGKCWRQHSSSSDLISPLTGSFHLIWVYLFLPSTRSQRWGTSEVACVYFYKNNSYLLVRLCQALCTMSSHHTKSFPFGNQGLNLGCW